MRSRHITSKLVLAAFSAVAASVLPASTSLAALGASATISTPDTHAPYHYTVTLHNTGTTNIGAFWFAWTPTPRSYNFLPTTPTGISAPTGWLSPVTHNAAFSQDGYGIEWYNISGSAIPVGGTQTFSFTSNDSPTVMAGPGWFPGFQVLHSVVYVGFPLGDPGFAFDATVRTACVADVDDGTGTGTPDGGVTIDDLLYYLTLFEQGAVAADVDDGTGSGTHDGGVTIDDLLYFLQRFEAGC